MKQELEEFLLRWPLGGQFDLPKDSTVVVVGAYKGITIELIDELYHPKLIKGYDPQTWAVLEAMSRLAGRTNIEVINAAIGTKLGSVELGEFHTDACSIVNVGPQAREHGTGAMIPAEIAFNEDTRMSFIDLMIMNIEGYEYTLLPHLRSLGVLMGVQRLAVQWHLDLAPGTSEEDMDKEVNMLILHDDYVLRLDQRPSWTYMTKVKD